MANGHLTTWISFNHRYSRCISWVTWFSFTRPIPSMGALQISLYSWYPLTTLDTVNACTIILVAPPFCSARDDKINDYGF